MGFYLWGLEGVVSGEVNCKEKHSTLVRAVWGAHDCSLKGGSMQGVTLVKAFEKHLTCQ